MDIVSSEELEAVWSEARMDEKRRSGVLRTVIVHDVPAGDPRYAGGRSRIVKLLTGGGQHVGTVHEVVMPDGSVPHAHPKDYVRRNCSRVRLPAEPH